ncbi:MAG: zinc-binding dehydrogenase [Acidimicrobiales bacterium]|nr:zinc-binding dehydrogenase [Acidimicrobiales bacterium]
MRFAQLVGSRSLEVVVGADPAPRPGQAVVAIDYCGIGGSDRSAWVTGEVASPAWFGHEWTGRIVQLAQDMPDRFVGQRVVAAVGPSCGQCRPCAFGTPAHCERVLEQIVGLDPLAASHGGFATHTVADARRLMPVGEAIDSRDAVLTEPAAVAAHAVRRSGFSLGDVVVVLGTGTIGLLTAELARIGGAAAVVSVDHASARRELACDLGADAAFAGVNKGLTTWLHDHTNGLGADVVFVCVDAAEAIAGGLGLVRPGGVIVAVGVGNQIENLSVTALLRREADFRVSLGYTIDDVRRVQTLMGVDQLRVRRLLQPANVALDQLADALQNENQSSGPPKAVVGVSA